MNSPAVEMWETQYRDKIKKSFCENVSTQRDEDYLHVTMVF